MKSKTKTSANEQQEFRSSNKQELEAICAWINTNINSPIGWDDLSGHSKRSHKDLIELFRQINTTPMAYIRYVKETLKLKEDIQTKTSKVVKGIEQTTVNDAPLKRSELITQNRIAAQNNPSRTKLPAVEKKTPTLQESIEPVVNAERTYQSRKNEIIHKIQSIDNKVQVNIDGDMDMYESVNHIIVLRKGDEIRTVGLNKDEFLNVGDQFNITAWLRIITALNEIREIREIR